MCYQPPVNDSLHGKPSSRYPPVSDLETGLSRPAHQSAIRSPPVPALASSSTRRVLSLYRHASFRQISRCTKERRGGEPSNPIEKSHPISIEKSHPTSKSLTFQP